MSTLHFPNDKLDAASVYDANLGKAQDEINQDVDNVVDTSENTAINSPDKWISGYYINSSGKYRALEGSIATRTVIPLSNITQFKTGNISDGYYCVYDNMGLNLGRTQMEANHVYRVANILILFPSAYSIAFDIRDVDGDTSYCNLIDIQYKTNTTTSLLCDSLKDYIQLSATDFTIGIWSVRTIDSRTDVICNRLLIPVDAGDKVIYKSTTLKTAIGLYVGNSMSIQHATGWVDESADTKEFVCAETGLLVVMLKKASGDILPREYNADIKVYNTINARAKSDAAVEKIINTSEKTVAFLGDSLTAGVGTNYIYHMYIAERYGWHCKNYGYGGSGYVISFSGTGGKMATGQEGMGDTITNSNKFTPNDFYTRIQTITTSIDALVIFGGINDWGYNASMSDFNTALDNVFSYAQTTFGRKPIIVMLPCHRLNDDTQNTAGNTLQDYIDAIVAKCRKYGIICIDTLAESGLNPSNNTNKTDFFTRDDNGDIDGIHPNHYAHKLISNLVAPAIMNKLY